MEQFIPDVNPHDVKIFDAVAKVKTACVLWSVTQRLAEHVTHVMHVTP